MKAAGGLQRWRRHGALNTAILLSFAAALFDVLALMDLLLPGSRSMDRGNPFYWALLMPPVVWGVAASGFSAWTVQLFRPVCLGLLALSVVLPLWLWFGEVIEDTTTTAAFAVVGGICALAALLISRQQFFAEFVADIRSVSQPGR